MIPTVPGGLKYSKPLAGSNRNKPGYHGNIAQQPSSMTTKWSYHGKAGLVAEPAGHDIRPTHEGSREVEKGDDSSSHASVKQLASFWSPKGLSFLINVVISSIVLASIFKVNGNTSRGSNSHHEGFAFYIMVGFS